jgi:hypothetical protein
MNILKTKKNEINSLYTKFKNLKPSKKKNNDDTLINILETTDTKEKFDKKRID